MCVHTPIWRACRRTWWRAWWRAWRRWRSSRVLESIKHSVGRCNACRDRREHSVGRHDAWCYRKEHADGRHDASAIGESTLSPVMMLDAIGESTLSAVKMFALSERARCRPSECLMRWEKAFWRAEMLNLRKLSQKSHPKGTSYPKKHYLCAHIFVSTS